MPDTIMDDPRAHASAGERGKTKASLGVYLDLLQHVGDELKKTDSSLLYRVAFWHILIKMLKWMENAPEWDESETHLQCLDSVILFGKWLQLEAKQNNTVLSKAEHGTTEAELGASLKWLNDKRNMCHGDVTPARKAEVLNLLFGDAVAA